MLTEESAVTEFRGDGVERCLRVGEVEQRGRNDR
jgi:hypothetical protein